MLTLSAYRYQIEFKPRSQQDNADALSRLPLDEAPKDVPVPGDTICLMEALDSCGPVTATVIKSWTNKDPALSHVRNLVPQLVSSFSTPRFSTLPTETVGTQRGG